MFEHIARPRIQFNDNQICNACNWSNKKKELNWNEKKELSKLIKKYKSENGSFDCIVPMAEAKMELCIS